MEQYPLLGFYFELFWGGGAYQNLISSRGCWKKNFLVGKVYNKYKNIDKQ